MCRNHDRFSLMRRQLLLATASAGVLAACGQRSAGRHASQAAEFTPDTVCVLDGLRLIDYPGPKAQIHYSGRDAPDFFCDTVEMFHVFLAVARRQDIRGMFVQDIGKTGWDEPQGHWIDARQAHYVHGSSRFGPMGPTLASFSVSAEAEAFARQFGGKLLQFDDVTPDMVILDGGALHDTRM